MARTVWTLRYRLDGADDAAYFAWFHGEHIPDKRARPGYTWAAHYADGAGCYLALFGADEVRTFLDPSPGQLKLRQDETTRRMVPHRREVVASVLVEVARVGDAGIVPDAVRMTVVEPAGPGEDESAVAMVQRHMADAARQPGFRWVTFLVPVIGSGKHVLIEAADRLGPPCAGLPPPAFAGTRIDTQALFQRTPSRDPG
ncbi:MAG: hypothetical protein FJY43_06335 [Betaproteobacteria bacterium]|nr:hypothetical protein [Betaproteobacteria bacterium]